MSLSTTAKGPDGGQAHPHPRGALASEAMTIDLAGPMAERIYVDAEPDWSWSRKESHRRRR